MAGTAAVLAAAACGVAAGCALPTLVYRLSGPANQASTTRSCCHQCQWPFPAGLSGWLRVRNRCPRCHQRLGPPTAATIAAATATCALLALRLPTSPLLPVLLASAIPGVAAALVDLR